MKWIKKQQQQYIDEQLMESSRDISLLFHDLIWPCNDLLTALIDQSVSNSVKE